MSNNTSRPQKTMKDVPQRPGVYLFKDTSNKIIYIGKAANLKNRISSYFHQGKTDSPKTDYLKSQISSFELIATENEAEALLLECNLIKKHKPWFNIDLKDDKSYPYIKLTIKDEYPTAFITRNKVEDGSLYYGPYVNAGRARHLLTLMRKHLLIRSCTASLRSIKRPCLMYHIHRCLGPCMRGKVDKNRYAETIEDVKLLLSGKNRPLIRKLKDKMSDASKKQEYEQAASYRDFIKYLDSATTRQAVLQDRKDEEDIFGYDYGNKNIVVQLFNVRKGLLVGRKEFSFKRLIEQSPSELLRSVVSQYYLDSVEIPASIVLPTPIKDAEALQGILSKKRGTSCHFVIPLKGRRMRLINLAMENARLSNETLHSSGDNEVAMMELQKALKLVSPPFRIEAFDISTLQGSETVASMVVFKKGKPEKSSYRKYNIKTVSGVDDYASMKEVVYRRYKRLISTDENLPDLILVDGGPGQITAAKKGLAEAGIFDQAISSIAKKEEMIYLPGKSAPIRLPVKSPALKLMQQIRDEAHRFAVTAQRKKRRKKGLSSVLEEIPGIGPANRKKLLQHFGSLEKIRSAMESEIAEIIGPQKAGHVSAFMKQKNQKG